MPKVTINGSEIEVDAGTTILRAAAMVGYEVPHFCYHPALSSPANCRMCLVELKHPDGRELKLQPACYMTMQDGAVIETENERVIQARKAVLEFILLNHPVDCPICDKAGECKLQDYYVAYDAQESRLRAQKQHKVKVFPIGPEIVYDGERCILCTRCIRFCEEITYTGELTLADRGDRSEVRTFPGRELDNDYSMCTVDVCPVGALTSRDFRFKCRVWLLTSSDSICTGCATGCNVHMDHFRNEVQRLRPRNNPQVNEYWMCDEGRKTYKEIHLDDRLLQPMANGGSSYSWHKIAETTEIKLRDRAELDGEGVAFLLSPQASVEDLYAARLFAEQALGDKVEFYVGGKPSGRTDKVAEGSADDDGRLRLIDADKNPNRRGLDLLFHDHELKPFSALLEAIDAGSAKVLYMMGVDLPEASLQDDFQKAVRSDGLLFILQASRDAGYLKDTHLAFSACSHAEKRGSFVNCDGILQPFDQAFAPHGSSLPDWSIFQRIGGAMGAKMAELSWPQLQKAAFDFLDEAADALEARQAEQAPAEQAPSKEDAGDNSEADEAEASKSEASQSKASESKASESKAEAPAKRDAKGEDATEVQAPADLDEDEDSADEDSVEEDESGDDKSKLDAKGDKLPQPKKKSGLSQGEESKPKAGLKLPSLSSLKKEEQDDDDSPGEQDAAQEESSDTASSDDTSSEQAASEEE